MIRNLFRKYKQIYPKIDHIRGTYRLYEFLQNQAFSSVDLELIDDSQAQEIYDFEWDTLLILDACRHDLFEEVINKKIPYRYSVGSHSQEFIEKTFSEGDFTETVVVTGNPHYFKNHFKLTGRTADETFACVWHTYQDKWDEEKGTVMPKSLIEDYKTAKKLYPDKRIIVHFMQPHFPFVGSDLLREHKLTGFSQYIDAQEKITEWDLAERGVITDETVWKAYKENLEFVLDVIRENRKVFKGQTMITADHGNLVGEEGFYDHPGGRNEKTLRKVPWVELEKL